MIHGDLGSVFADAYLIPGDGRFVAGRKWSGQLPQDAGRYFDADPRSALTQARGKEVEGRLYLLADIGTSDSYDVSAALQHLLRGVEDAFKLSARHFPAGCGAPNRERPLLAMPLVGTARGGFATRKGALVQGLIEFLEESVPGQPFDVVVVCYERSSYAAVQQSRRTEDDLPPALAGHVQRLAEHARAGGLAVLFGAGASMPVGLPSWDKLLGDLGSAGERGSDVDLNGLREGLRDIDPVDAASVVLDILKKQGRVKDFEATLKGQLGVHQHSLMHGLIASIRPRVAVTTNYDQLYELAMRRVLDDGEVCVMPWDRPGHPEDARLLKLHGDLDKGSVVLSRDQFIEMHAQRRPLTALLQDHMLAGHVLAVGTSLSDPTMAQAAEEVSSLLRSVLPEQTGPPEVGTWIQTVDHPARRIMWQRLFAVGCGDEGLPTGEGLDWTLAGARMVDVLLDAVARASSDDVSFLADPVFDDLVEAREWDLLARKVHELREALDPVLDRGGPFRQLDRALNDLGAHRRLAGR